MSKNVKYYFKRDGTELCPHTKTKISSPFCLYLCKHCIKKNYVSGWIICEKLNKDAWRKKSEELIKVLECDEYFEHLLSIRYNPSVYLNKLSDILAKTVCNSETVLNNLQNALTNITEMKKENINIEIPKGYVPELKDGKITLVYKGSPLDDMPKSWKELEKIGGEYINEDAEINGTRDGCDTDVDNKNIIPKGLGKPILALIQLLQLRNRTWEVTNSKPTCDCPWVISYNGLSDTIERFTTSTNHSMKFSSEMVALKFSEYHRDLLWEARELL
jgi:hypothetical protein